MDTFIQSVATVLVFGIIIGGPVACEMNDTNKIAEMVADGVDPVAARCAVEGNEYDQCSLALIKRKEK